MSVCLEAHNLLGYNSGLQMETGADLGVKAIGFRCYFLLHI